VDGDQLSLSGRMPRASGVPWNLRKVDQHRIADVHVTTKYQTAAFRVDGGYCQRKADLLRPPIWCGYARIMRPV